MKKLNTIDADTLLSTPLPATSFIVDSLLPEGLHLLAGSPKTGKSWPVLWTCLCISKGEPVWDLPTAQGTVLYLCLEDSYTRIQNRLFQITDDAPDTLHFANLSESIGGLEDQIMQFLAEYPDTVLIVIDMLQKIRDIVPESNSYANDYRELSLLKELADRHHIAVLLIHHLRKLNDTDPMNMISGTTGLSGVTDSNFVLKRKDRSSPSAELHCTGRDIDSRVLELAFQQETHTWTLAAPLKTGETSLDPEAISLSAFLKPLQNFTGTATELSALLEQETGKLVSPALLPGSLQSTIPAWRNPASTFPAAGPEIPDNCISSAPRVTAVTGATEKMGAEFSVTAVKTITRAPVQPCEAVCAAFSGQVGGVVYNWINRPRSAFVGQTAGSSQLWENEPGRRDGKTAHL